MDAALRRSPIRDAGRSLALVGSASSQPARSRVDLTSTGSADLAHLTVLRKAGLVRGTASRHPRLRARPERIGRVAVVGRRRSAPCPSRGRAGSSGRIRAHRRRRSTRPASSPRRARPRSANPPLRRGRRARARRARRPPRRPRCERPATAPRAFRGLASRYAVHEPQVRPLARAPAAAGSGAAKPSGSDRLALRLRATRQVRCGDGLEPDDQRAKVERLRRAALEPLARSVRAARMRSTAARSSGVAIAPSRVTLVVGGRDPAATAPARSSQMLSRPTRVTRRQAGLDPLAHGPGGAERREPDLEQLGLGGAAGREGAPSAIRGRSDERLQHWQPGGQERLLPPADVVRGRSGTARRRPPPRART